MITDTPRIKLNIPHSDTLTALVVCSFRQAALDHLESIIDYGGHAPPPADADADAGDKEKEKEKEAEAKATTQEA